MERVTLLRPLTRVYPFSHRIRTNRIVPPIFRPRIFSKVKRKYKKKIEKISIASDLYHFQSRASKERELKALALKLINQRKKLVQPQSLVLLPSKIQKNCCPLRQPINSKKPCLLTKSKLNSILRKILLRLERRKRRRHRRRIENKPKTTML